MRRVGAVATAAERIEQNVAFYFTGEPSRQRAVSHSGVVVSDNWVAMRHKIDPYKFGELAFNYKLYTI